MKNLTYTILLLFFFLKSNDIFAETYRSFEFQNNELAARNDISGIYSKLSIELSSTEAASIKKVSLASIDMYLFKEVADFMTVANNPSGKPWTPIATPTLCEEHKKFNLEDLPKIKNSCPLLKLDFLMIKKEKNLFSNCQNAYQPDLYVEEIPAGEVKVSRLNDLPGLIQTIAWPLRYMEISGNLVTPEMLTKMRFLLTKIRMSDLLEKVQRNKEIITRIMNDLKHERCLEISDSELSALKTKLETINAEILAAENYLNTIDQEGRRLAEIDRQKVLDSGKTRAELPYPNLTDADREYITMYVSAIMWRFRGGGVLERSDSTQFRRIFYTWRPVNVLARLNGGDKGQGIGFDIFLGLLKMWGQYFDMGMNPVEQDKYYDITKMTERGLYQVKFANRFLRINGFSTNYMTMAGLQMGPLYYYATYSNLAKLFYPGKTEAPFREAVAWSTDWGEVLFGANLGIAISRTFLQGYDPSFDKTDQD